MVLSKVEIETAVTSNPNIQACLTQDDIKLFVDKIHSPNDLTTSDDIYLKFSKQTITDFMKSSEYLEVLKMQHQNSEIYNRKTNDGTPIQYDFDVTASQTQQYLIQKEAILSEEKLDQIAKDMVVYGKDFMGHEINPEEPKPAKPEDYTKLLSTFAKREKAKYKSKSIEVEKITSILQKIDDLNSDPTSLAEQFAEKTSNLNYIASTCSYALLVTAVLSGHQGLSKLSAMIGTQTEHNNDSGTILNLLDSIEDALEGDKLGSTIKAGEYASTMASNILLATEIASSSIGNTLGVIGAGFSLAYAVKSMTEYSIKSEERNKIEKQHSTNRLLQTDVTDLLEVQNAIEKRVELQQAQVDKSQPIKEEVTEKIKILSNMVEKLESLGLDAKDSKLTSLHKDLQTHMEQLHTINHQEEILNDYKIELIDIKNQLEERETSSHNIDEVASNSSKELNDIKNELEDDKTSIKRAFRSFGMYLASSASAFFSCGVSIIASTAACFSLTVLDRQHDKKIEAKREKSQELLTEFNENIKTDSSWKKALYSIDVDVDKSISIKKKGTLKEYSLQNYLEDKIHESPEKAQKIIEDLNKLSALGEKKHTIHLKKYCMNDIMKSLLLTPPKPASTDELAQKWQVSKPDILAQVINEHEDDISKKYSNIIASEMENWIQEKTQGPTASVDILHFQQDYIDLINQIYQEEKDIGRSINIEMEVLSNDMSEHLNKTSELLGSHTVGSQLFNEIKKSSIVDSNDRDADLYEDFINDDENLHISSLSP